MIVDKSISFTLSYLLKMISVGEDEAGAIQKSLMFNGANHVHQAAVKLQKVYKSFRTRRKLADCAVLVEQSWWKLLDFAELKHSSVSFFGLEKHETAVSRWARARTRAAKVGKGLSKNDNAKKLALQHWLEAIDPRHRYGHNLHFYYVKWLHSKSREPFFYWLDIGEGKEINLVEECPRSKLQQQCIKYLGPMERKAYEVVIEDGKFVYKETGEILNTTEDAKWIFVLSTSQNLYVGQKKKGTFQHSSFLAGGATTAAGRLVVENGILKVVWPHSGHYRPTEENFKEFLSFLRENNVDLTNVKTNPVQYEEESGKHVRRGSFDDNSLPVDYLMTEDFHLEESNPKTRQSSGHQHKKLQRWNFLDKLPRLHKPKREKTSESKDVTAEVTNKNHTPKPNVEGQDSRESRNKHLPAQQGTVKIRQNVHNLEHDEEVTSVPQEAILQRISSKRSVNSYQLGKQLSCRWTTGAGPRIGCVRDYPAELQFQALEKMKLSPGNIVHSKSTSALSSVVVRSNSLLALRPSAPS